MKTFLATILALGMAATAAHAVPTNITVDSSGALLHAIGIADAAQYDAAVGNPPTSNDSADNLAFLNTMIGNWNGASLSPTLPAAGTLQVEQGSLTGTTYDGSANSGYEYIVIHFGAGNAGGQQRSPGGYWVAYYLGGDTLSFSAVPQVDGRNVGGFSSARYYGVHDNGGGGPNLPDGGSVLALLGLGLVVVGGARRMANLA